MTKNYIFYLYALLKLCDSNIPRTPIEWNHLVQGHIPSRNLIDKKNTKEKLNDRYQNHRKILKRIVEDIVPVNQES